MTLGTVGCATALAMGWVVGTRGSGGVVAGGGGSIAARRNDGTPGGNELSGAGAGMLTKPCIVFAVAEFVAGGFEFRGGGGGALEVRSTTRLRTRETDDIGGGSRGVSIRVFHPTRAPEALGGGVTGVGEGEGGTEVAIPVGSHHAARAAGGTIAGPIGARTRGIT